MSFCHTSRINLGTSSQNQKILSTFIQVGKREDLHNEIDVIILPCAFSSFLLQQQKNLIRKVNVGGGREKNATTL